jgi:hypothetical protein
MLFREVVVVYSKYLSKTKLYSVDKKQSSFFSIKEYDANSKNCGL